MQHIKALHGVSFDGDDPHDKVRWTPYSCAYDFSGIHVRGEKVENSVAVYGTSLYYQSTFIDGKWFGFLVPMGLPRPGYTKNFMVVAGKHSDGTPAEVEQWLDFVIEFEKAVVMEDLPIMETIRFRPGTLTRSDLHVRTLSGVAAQVSARAPVRRLHQIDERFETRSRYWGGSGHDEQFQGLVVCGRSRSDQACRASASPHNSAEPAVAPVEEIVVTARKREERLIEVPDSVTTLSARAIESAGVANVKDVARFVPNLSIVEAQQPGVSFITIRGVGQVRNGEAPVAVVIDGVQLFSANQITQDLFDIERIEVLRGPQGAVYGRNAIGGAINIVTRRADQ